MYWTRRREEGEEKKGGEGNPMMFLPLFRLVDVLGEPERVEA